jgi:fumarate hydratase class II
MSFRIEKDTMGNVEVPADKYWGAQTERSRNNFKIGAPASMPLDIVYGFAYLKKAAAYANCDLGILESKKRDLIAAVCDEILAGKHDDQFPLVIWQTGSGTQSNMNVNEVIANRAQELAGGKIGEGEKVIQPNDDVNKSQSSNDTFPTGMHIAAYKKIVEVTIPGVEKLRDTIETKSRAFNGRHSPHPWPRVFWLCFTTKSRPKSPQKYLASFVGNGPRRHCCWNWSKHP